MTATKVALDPAVAGIVTPRVAAKTSMLALHK